MGGPEARTPSGANSGKLLKRHEWWGNPKGKAPPKGSFMIPSTAGFQDPKAARALKEAIARGAERAGRSLKIMEVCGTHTMAIARFGLRSFLPPNVTLVSGPGCPVCVTPDAVIDAAIRCARMPGTTVATFGDMVRVPGTETTLERCRAEGADVRVVYSPLDALEGAIREPGSSWIFLGIGFETTAPLVAATLEKARREGVSNFSVLCAHKTVPPALHALLADKEAALDGFLCPGHVSVIIGPEPYEGVAAQGAPCVIAGFEPLDILQGIRMLVEQVAEDRADVENQYTRAVKPGGNPKARGVMDAVFESSDARWRGLGVLPDAGLTLREEVAHLDAALRYALPMEGPDADHGCRCGDVLRGKLLPAECPLFARTCRPETPVGPCMVSAEGSCAAAYRYERHSRLSP
jgi:hydrogenase expression/formation protein HypD